MIVFDHDERENADVSLRQRQILAIVQRQGYATVEALAAEFQVSTQSVRRDIIRLDTLGLLQRFHGGAGVLDAPVRLGYEQKLTAAITAKDRIARATIALLPPGGAIYLDYGTTCEAVARALRGRNDVRVVTASLAVAQALTGTHNASGFEPVMLGGQLRGVEGAALGDLTLSALAQFRFDTAVLGCSGFDSDGAPTDFDLDKIAVKRMALAQARVGMIVADASKFPRSALARLAPVTAFHHLITDATPPFGLAQAFQQADVAIVVAD